MQEMDVVQHVKQKQDSNVLAEIQLNQILAKKCAEMVLEQANLNAMTETNYLRMGKLILTYIT